MDNKQIYKIYQVVDVLISEYGYTNAMISKDNDGKFFEAFLVNFKNPNYQLIRVTLESASNFYQERNRVNSYTNYFKKTYNNDVKLLDIHICFDKYNGDLEDYDYANIEENYHDGIDLFSIYPKLQNVIHNVSNGEKETKNIIKRITNRFKAKRKQLPLLKRYPCFFNHLIIGICILVYIIQIILGRKYSDTNVAILLGADYKTFTLGLHQYWRLITYGFVHGDAFHLLCNMTAMFSMGNIVERVYGHNNYLIILFVSVIFGSLTHSVFASNSILVGMSAGIYALTFIAIVYLFKNRFVNARSIMPTLFINFYINFIQVASWSAHLGGLIAGYLLYQYLEKEDKKVYIILILVVFVGLMVKFHLTNSYDLYAGTDLEIINILKEWNLNSLADRWFKKLLAIYAK